MERPQTIGRLATACVALALLVALAAPAAVAATIQVTCPGPPTLQTAIDGAMAGETIEIAAGTCTENVTIDKNLTLRGVGAASTFLDGGLAGTVVTVTGGAAVELAALTVRRGSAINGGGVWLGSGSSLTLRDAVVTDSVASNDGGGIYATGGGSSIELVGSTVTANVAAANGGGIFAASPNTGPFSTVTVTDSTIGGNGATTVHGGGVVLSNSSAAFTRSTVSGNEAGDDGGAIYAVGIGSATLTNVTISGNSASNDSATGFGGGIFVRATALAATHTTIFDNTGWRGGGVYVASGETTASFRATILTGNVGTSGVAPNPDCARIAGTVLSTGFNLFGATAPGDCGFTAAATDLVGADPRLGPLQDNGSPFTHALLADSPAIDAVTSGCPPPATDARGVTRPQGAYCDAGAYEAPPGPVPDTVGLVDPSQGRWQLRNSVGQVTSFFYGNPDDIPFMGDWDCDGDATPGLFRQSDAFAYLRNTNSVGIADIRFFFGNPDDLPLAGDWNGDGCDTLSIYRPSEQRFYIINELGENEGGLGQADFFFTFGNPGDKPVAGDWDGDRVDEVGLHRESTGFFYFRNTLTTGIADGELYFGDPDDRFVAGDWGLVDGKDTPAVFRPSRRTFFFRHTLTQGPADSEFVFGESPWLPVAGRFGLG